MYNKLTKAYYSIIHAMILVTGGTGFIGCVLVRQLVESGHNVRMLLRPSPRSPRLPTGVPVEVAVCSLSDTRSLRAAMRGVDTVYHLAGSEGGGGRADLLEVDMHGSRNLAEAAMDARIKRIFYVSHLDADRGSGYPLLKAKGIAEEYIRRSGIPHTILRSSVVFGLGDGFTTGLALLLTFAPGFLPLPAQGKTLVQPLWVEDLVTCLVWALDEPGTINQTYEVGGGEYFTLRQVVETIMQTIQKPRLLFPMSIPLLRALTVVSETIFRRFPASIFWMDYLAANRTCPVDTIPRVFGLMPARFTARLGYLTGIHWRRELLKRLFVPHA